DRFAKALAAGADTVIIDLEDAVGPEDKGLAREHITAFAGEHPQATFMVRVNGAQTAWFDDDLTWCQSLPAVAGVVLPKAENASQVAEAAHTGKPVMPIIESARGVLAMSELAKQAHVQRLSFGYLDLMLELGTTPDTGAARTVLDQVRVQLLVQSAACGL